MVVSCKRKLTMLVVFGCMFSYAPVTAAALSDEVCRESSRSVSCDSEGNNVYVTVNRPASSELTINVTVHKPCSSNCSSQCTEPICFDKLDESLCNAESFSHFLPMTGEWQRVSNYVTTSAPVQTFNFLRHAIQVDQAHQVLEVQMTFAERQLLEQYVSAGLVSHCDGLSSAADSSVVYITFDNRSGVPTNPRLAIQSQNDDLHLVVFNIPFAINLGQTYTLRLVKNLQETSVYIDDTFIGFSPSSGTYQGNYVGVWAFQATAQFKNLVSCSYLNPVPAPTN